MSSIDYSKQPSIITGAGGFMGRHMVRFFKAKGWPVIALGRVDCDLTNREQVLNVFKELPKAGRIFHLATHQRTGAIQYEIPAELLQINSRMHLNVLEAWGAYLSQAKFVGAGSSCAYPVLNDPIPETAFQTGKLHDSVRGYGLAKQALVVGAETHAHQYKSSAIVCVFATLYGPGDHLENDRSHFIGGMMRRALEDQKAGKKEMLVYGTPQTTRECLYVTDQIDALLAADAAFDKGLINAAANQPVTLAQMAKAIQEAISWNVPIVFPQGGYTGADRKQLDSSKFLAATHWQPKTQLVAGLRELAQDLRTRLSL